METQPVNPLMILLAVLGFLVVFPLFWSGVVFLISRLSGWATLAGRYRTDRPVGGIAGGRIRMGVASYDRVLRLEARPEGLAMDVFVLFRPGHVPLCVPWAEVYVAGPAPLRLFTPGVRLELGEDAVSMVIPAAVWASLEPAARAGGARTALLI